MRIPTILTVLGFLLVATGAAMLCALPFSYYYGGSDAVPLLSASGLSIVVGLLLWWIFKRRQEELRAREGFAIVTLGWVSMSLFGSLPFLFSGAIPSFTDAFFETISGFTTTGASILRDVEAMPHGLLFWRSMTHWIGGMGIIVLSIAILPLLGVGGMQLFKAEVPGVTVDKLSPRVTETAKILWGVYILMTVAQTILLLFGGMSLFDALCHTFGTVATGGFSTRNASVASFQSAYIEYVIIFFMFLAGVSFALHFRALKGDLKSYLRDNEVTFYAITIILAVVLIAYAIPSHLVSSGEELFRQSLFQVVSIITTTGFGTADYELWLPIAHIILLLLMFNGGCAGSTAGGMKIVRILLLLKNGLIEIRKLIHPKAIFPLRHNGRSVHAEIISSVLAFFVLYVTIFVLATIAMTALGLDILSAAGSVVATLSNIGPGLGAVGPSKNYADIPLIGKWILSFCMLVGRLELFTVLILFTGSFWKR